MFASTGLTTPPCGVPIVTLLLTLPSLLIGALRKRCIREITLPSSILSDNSCKSLLWFTVSKNLLRSRSITHSRPLLRYSNALVIAPLQLLVSLNPKLLSENTFSYSSASIKAIACCTNRSFTVGMPRGRFYTLSFGIYTRLIGCGLYFPSRIDFEIS